MLISKMFSRKYFKSDDFKGDRRLTLTIAEVVPEIIKGEDGEEEKWVVYFEEEDRGLVLNVTNARTLEEFSGSDDSDDWIGLRVTLFTTRVDFAGKRVSGIRIDPAPSKPSGGTGGARAQKPLRLTDKADEPENDAGQTNPDTEPDPEGSPWEKEAAHGK
jgi:hypothetical protein